MAAVTAREPVRIMVTSPTEVEVARRAARQLAQELSFTPADVEAVAIAVTELGTNLVRYARSGVIRIWPAEGSRGRSIQVESQDQGPGISDLARALEDGYSTGGGLGSGLPAVRRLMDEFDVESNPAGTIITAAKWLRRR